MLVNAFIYIVVEQQKWIVFSKLKYADEYNGCFVETKNKLERVVRIFNFI